MKVFAVSFLLLLLCGDVYADTQGANNGSSFSSDGSGTDWSNPSYAQTSNTQYTTITAATKMLVDTANHFSTGFGFTIPAGSTIDGIIVEIQRKSVGGAGTSDNQISIVKDGSSSAGTSGSSNVWTSTLTYYTFGGSTNKWGTTWTVSEINDANFGVMFSAVVGGSSTASCTASVDHVRITVYYTPSGKTINEVTNTQWNETAITGWNET